MATGLIKWGWDIHNKRLKMKPLLLTSLFLTLFYTAYGQTIDVAGFGSLNYQKNENAYTIDLDKYGRFDFIGTLKPLQLETKLTNEQLKAFPGQEVLSELELEEVYLKLKKDSLTLEARAGTEKKLKPLCEALNINAPYLNIAALLNPNFIQLEGRLDFGKDPIQVDISDEIGTRFILLDVGMGASLGYSKQNQPMLKVFTNTQVRPTHKDKDLATNMELSYHLLTQEITATGSMVDEWVNPLGMSEYITIREDAVTISNTGMSAGWIPGAPTPTTIGFAAEQAQFFELEYGAQISLAPAKKEVALRATRKEVTSEDFVRMLEEDFSLNLPKNLFPKDMLIKDAELLFSPSGGRIAEQIIDKGFIYKGGLEIADSILSGDMAFMAKNKEDLSLDVDLHTEDIYELLNQYIGQGKDNKLQEALEKALSKFEIKRMFVHLEADKALKMAGNTICELIIFGKEVNLKFKATLSPNEITKNMIAKIGVIALEYLKEKKE